MIKVKDLTKIYKTAVKDQNFLADIFFRKYQETVALNQASFKIDENELVGFIGPNGAGKTTTLKILSGILYPTSGEVKVLGFIPFEKDPRFLKQISFIMGQRNQLVWDLPPYDTFLLNKEIYNVADSEFKAMVDELSALLNCQKLLFNPVKTLSLGERMKMELIASLLHRPKIVFFDEPTIGLDIFSQEVVRDFIKKFQMEYKATIMLTSHYLEDVKKLAKRLIIIDRGNILYDGSLRNILDKYSRQKKITLTLDDEVGKEELAKIGQIEHYSFPQVVFKTNKSDIPSTVKLITDTLPFSDLTIEDETIEEIIKSFFSDQTIKEVQ